MTRIISPLEKMGAHILARNGVFAPYTLVEKTLKALEFTLPIPSAQLKSCILLAGLFGEEESCVIQPTPSRDHTERLLQLSETNALGIRHIYASKSDEIPAQNYRIPGDYSAAAFWLVAGSIVPNSVITLQNVGLNPTRIASLQILKEMGAQIGINEDNSDFDEPTAELTVQTTELTGIDIPQEWIPNAIDSFPY